MSADVDSQKVIVFTKETRKTPHGQDLDLLGGSLIFETNGRYSLTLMKSDLPKYLSNSRIQGTPWEYKTTVEGSLFHLGTYSVSGTDLIFHVEASTFPNWNNTDQRRAVLSVTGDELKYTNPTPSSAYQRLVITNAPYLVWQRVK
jgi:hypothetical protein